MERDRSLRERVRQGSHASLDLSKEDAVRRAARARHVRAKGGALSCVSVCAKDHTRRWICLRKMERHRLSPTALSVLSARFLFSILLVSPPLFFRGGGDGPTKASQADVAFRLFRMTVARPRLGLSFPSLAAKVWGDNQSILEPSPP